MDIWHSLISSRAIPGRVVFHHFGSVLALLGGEKGRAMAAQSTELSSCHTAKETKAREGR